MSPSARLGEKVSEVRSRLGKMVAGAIGIWFTVGVSLVFVTAWILAESNLWSQGSRVPALLDMLVLIGFAGSWLGYYLIMRYVLADEPLAVVMERAAGLRSGVLRGSIELGRELPGGVSRLLANEAASRVLGTLGKFSSGGLTGDLGKQIQFWTRRGLNTLMALTLLLVILGVANPSRSSRALGSLSSPLKTMRDPVLARIVVTPGSIEVLRGSDVQVTVQAPGRQSVTLGWQAAGDIARSELLDLLEDRATYVFQGVGATIDYQVHAEDGGESEPYRITPIDPLFISELMVGVTYPPHTGFAPDEYRGDPPPLRLPVGSSLIFEGQASRMLSEADLRDSLGVIVAELTTDSEGFGGIWRPRSSGLFDWSISDSQGNPPEVQPEPIHLTLVPDSAPHITIPLPGQDTILSLNLQQPLIIEASDDYGLDRIELVAYRVTAFGERNEPVAQSIDLGGTRAALARPLLDLTTWGLLPGDTVRYFARAIDNSPAEQISTTREYVLFMPIASELQRAAEEQLEATAERLEELAAEAARQAEENRNLAREAAAQREIEEGSATDEQGRPDFEERQDLQRALEDQRQLSDQVDSLQAELAELERIMEEAGQSDPELARDLKELQELLEQLNDSDLQERMDELAQSLQEDDLQRANESLDQLSQQQEDFRERLEESLERFRRAAVEQDFRATTREAEELARQERALADAMREEDNPDLRPRQQAELRDRAEDLDSRMERLEERLLELDEREASAGVNQAQQSMQQAQVEMGEAQEKATQGRNQEAGQDADQAAAAMEQASKELQAALDDMAQQQSEAMQGALEQTADDALSLARRQSELGEEMRGASQEQVASMRGEEASLLQGVENIARNLQEESDGAFSGNPALAAQMGQAMESIENTIQAMGGRRGSMPSPYAQAEQTVGQLNRLALMAIASAEQMGQAQQQSGENAAEQLEQLAQEQGEVMNQTGQLMPMELGQQAMAQQMQELAAGQESIASDLGDLAEQPGSEDETLGDLEQMAQEAEALAQAMAEGRLTPETVRRQERLFHRLLDAGRSLEREEFSEERESEEPGAFERGEIMPLTPDQLGALRYQLPDSDQLQRLSPAVRQLVIQYFERLNRGGAEPGSGR